MIGGNITAQLQLKTGTSKNAIGESVPLWDTVHTLTGFLDYSSGTTEYRNYNAPVLDSTNVFICDYIVINDSVSAENSRMIIDGKTYAVILIDDPMNLHKQLEFLLKFSGGIL